MTRPVSTYARAIDTLNSVDAYCADLIGPDPRPCPELALRYACAALTRIVQQHPGLADMVEARAAEIAEALWGRA